MEIAIMSNINIQLPSSLYHQATGLAQAEGVSLDQLIALALAEKLAALKTLSYLQERGAQGSRVEYEAILANVPDIAPEPHDAL
jgi:hypothetical protein